MIAQALAIPANPGGWASRNLGIGYMLLFMHPLGWIALFFALVSVLYRPARLMIAVLLAAASFFYSVFIYQITLSASDSEFTG